MVAYRKTSIIKNTISTDEMGRVYVMMTRYPGGSLSEGSEFFTVVDEGVPSEGSGKSRVYKYTFNGRAALKEAFFSDASMDSKAYGTGVTQTCSVMVQVIASQDNLLNIFDATELFAANTSIPTINDDGTITFYVLTYNLTWNAGFYLRLILSSQYVNSMRS